MLVPQASEGAALAIIDVQPNTLKGGPARAVLERICRYVETVPYKAYVVAEFSAPEDSMFFRQRGILKPADQTGATDPRIIAHLDRVQPPQLRLHKTTRSMFKGPQAAELADFLKAQSITELHFVGYDISDCVLASAYDAVDLGYYAFVLEELCHHHLSMDNLKKAATAIFRREQMSNHNLNDQIARRNVRL